MNFLEVCNGLELDKNYQLPGWGRFYLYLDENGIICIKVPSVEGHDYLPRISEIKSNEWVEINPKKTTWDFTI